MKNLTEYKIKIVSKQPFSDSQKLEFIRNLASRLEGYAAPTPEYVRGAEMTISLIRTSNEKIRTSDEKIVTNVDDMFVDKQIIETTKFVESQESINEINSLKKELENLKNELKLEKQKTSKTVEKIVEKTVVKEVPKEVIKIVEKEAPKKKTTKRKTKKKIHAISSTDEIQLPLDRVITEGVTHFCDICGSTMTKSGFLGLFGERRCDNDKCENSKPKS